MKRVYSPSPASYDEFGDLDDDLIAACDNATAAYESQKASQVSPQNDSQDYSQIDLTCAPDEVRRTLSSRSVGNSTVYGSYEGVQIERSDSRGGNTDVLDI
eukprot:7162289-Pyramimonas_sp.AAC.1